MSRSTVSFVIAVLGTIAFAYVTGIGGFRDAINPSDDVPTHVSDVPDGAGAPHLKKLPPAVNGVRTLYDDLWLVTEGQWWLGNGETYFDADPVTFQRLLESAGPDAVSVTVPGADGLYRTVVELHDAPPAVPSWCEDVAESSITMDAEPSAFQMGSFETFSVPLAFERGDYRVRYCTELQDRAAGEDAFVDDEKYTTYSGRHLLQIWQAPRAPDRTLRQGSDWAKSLTHAG